MTIQLLKQLDAFLITKPTNIRYLTGFVGAAPEEREAYVLLTKKQTYLFTNSLYREKAKALKGVTDVEISREEPFAKKLTELLKRSHPASQGETLQNIGFEENDLTVAEYHKIKLVHKNVMLVPTQGRIEKLRMIKRDDEIENIRAAARLTDECFDFIIGKIKPGISESDISWEIETFIRTHGALLAFSPIVAFGKNSSMPHYQPAESCKLTADSVILLDFGAKVNGYCSDMTRMVFVGKPKDEMRRAYETVREAQNAALTYFAGFHPARQGGTLQERSGATADHLARDVIGKANFPPYPHSLGHGVGLDIHEAPRLTINPSTLRQLADRSGLQPGMVITVEPAIYMEGSYGVRIEDLVLLKKDGIEILSTSKKEMIIL